MKELRLRKLVFLDENILNPLCHLCGKEMGGFLISEEDLLENFSPVDLGWLLQKHLIERTKEYEPQLIIYLCKDCCKGVYEYDKD